MSIKRFWVDNYASSKPVEEINKILKERNISDDQVVSINNMPMCGGVVVWYKEDDNEQNPS